MCDPVEYLYKQYLIVYQSPTNYAIDEFIRGEKQTCLSELSQLIIYILE